MKLSQRPKTRQSLSRRTIIIAASISVVAIVAILVFVFNVGHISKSYANSYTRIITTKAAGNWTSTSTWTNGTIPNSDDSVVILHNVTLNTSFAVGNGSKGAMYIKSGVTLNGTNTLALAKGADIWNYGTMSIPGLSFYGATNDAVSRFMNYGTATFTSDLSIWGNTVVVNNSGTITLSANINLNGVLTNSGTMNISGNMQSNAGKLSNSGKFTESGSAQFTGATVVNSPTSSSMTFIGAVTLNGTPTTKLTVTGKLYVGSTTTNNDMTINDGQLSVTGTGRVYIYGSLLMNVGTNNNKISNEGYINVLKSVTTHGPSVFTNSDTVIVQQAFTNGSAFTNSKGGYVGVTTDLFNQSKTSSSFTNGGYVYVARNFTNDYNTVYSGTGGGLKVQGVSTNNGTISGTTDICDATKSNSKNVVDNNNGTISGTVTTCQYKAPSPLPVTLTDFSAQRNDGTVHLKWTTVMELNNNHFDVERSDEDGKVFTKITEIKGHGTTNNVIHYEYTDENVSGLKYYRLKQVDDNGHYEYSKLLVSRAGDAADIALSVKVYPNPIATGSKLSIEIQAPQADNADVDLISLTGSIISRETFAVNQGVNVLSFPINAPADKIYLVRVTYQGKTTTEKLQVSR